MLMSCKGSLLIKGLNEGLNSSSGCGDGKKWVDMVDSTEVA